MALDAAPYLDGRLHAIYSYVDDAGVNVHIDAVLLREWCLMHKSELNVELAPVEDYIAKSFLDENVIDIIHAERVYHMPTWDPIIYCMDGTFHPGNGAPNVMLVDGHHRYFVSWLFKQRTVACYVLKPEQWKPFEIIGLPDLSREELIARPVAKTLSYNR